MKREPTIHAIKLIQALEKLDVFTITEMYDGHKHVDISIPKSKIDIEIDGPYHLTDSQQIIADLNRSHYSDKDGFRTLHIHNDEIDNNLEKIAKAIADAAKSEESRLAKI